jgi:hypothetical protein
MTLPPRDPRALSCDEALPHLEVQFLPRINSQGLSLVGGHQRPLRNTHTRTHTHRHHHHHTHHYSFPTGCTGLQCDRAPAAGPHTSVAAMMQPASWGANGMQCLTVKQAAQQVANNAVLACAATHWCGGAAHETAGAVSSFSGAPATLRSDLHSNLPLLPLPHRCLTIAACTSGALMALKRALSTWSTPGWARRITGTTFSITCTGHGGGGGSVQVYVAAPSRGTLHVGQQTVKCQAEEQQHVACCKGRTPADVCW